MKLTVKIPLLILSIAIIPLIVTSFIYFKNESEHINNSRVEHLKSVASIQEARVTQTVNLELDVFSLIASRTQMRLSLNQFLLTDDKSHLVIVDKILTDALNSTEKIHHISIYDQARNLITSTNKLRKNNHPIESSLLNNTIQGKSIHFDFTPQREFVFTVTGDLYLREQSIGLMQVEIYANEFFESLKDYSGLGLTGETVLAGKDINGDAIFLTPTRHDDQIALNLKVPKSNLEIPIIHAINGKETVFTDLLDYRQKPVLAISRHIPDLNWGIVVKIDKDEAFSYEESNRNFFIIIIFSSIAILVLTTLIVSRIITAPIEALTSIANRITQGDVTASADEGVDNELGELARSFNLMTHSLINTTEALEETIKDVQVKALELESNAERFEKWQSSNFIGIIQSNAKGKIIEANDALLDMIGYTREELENGEINWHTLTPENFYALDEQAIIEAKQKGFWTPFEKEYIHKDGHKVPIMIGGSLFYEEADQFIVFVVDLTDKYKAEEELRQYEHILSSTTDLLGLIGTDFTYIAVNKSYKELKSGLVGQHLSTFVGKDTFEKIAKPRLLECLDNNEVNFQAQVDLPRKGNCYIDVTYYPYKNERGDIKGVVSKVVDVTEKQHNLNLIKKQNVEQLHIVNSLLEGVISIDAEGIILTCNDSAYRMFGYPPNSLIGKNAGILMPDEIAKKHNECINNYSKTSSSTIVGSAVGRELYAVKKDGSHFPIQISVSELPSESTNKRRFLASIHDLTEYKQQEEIMRKSQKMEALGQLTSGISHDFNNLLGIVTGYSELLLTSGFINGKQKEYVDEILRAGERGAKLTKELLNFSSSESEHKQSLVINDLINKDKDLIQKTLTAQIILTLDLDESLSSVNVNSHLFEDILLNFCINAMHAMPDGGELIIKTSNCEITANSSSGLNIPKGHYVKLTLTDNGIGMSEEVKAKIFDPFFTTKKENGTGLGLAQVYKFITANKGYIEVESQPEKGTTFDLYLPATSQTIKQPNKASSASPSPIKLQNNETILVVDDEQALCEINCEYLQIEGYTVYSAYDAEQALEMIESTPIDLVLTDLVMPNMSGLELIKRANEKENNIKFIISSGYMKENLEQQNQFSILTKPYNRKELLSIVAETLKSNG